MLYLQWLPVWTVAILTSKLWLFGLNFEVSAGGFGNPTIYTIEVTNGNKATYTAIKGQVYVGAVLYCHKGYTKFCEVNLLPI